LSDIIHKDSGYRLVTKNDYLCGSWAQSERM